MPARLIVESGRRGPNNYYREPSTGAIGGYSANIAGSGQRSPRVNRTDNEYMQSPEFKSKVPDKGVDIVGDNRGTIIFAEDELLDKVEKVLTDAGFTQEKSK